MGLLGDIVDDLLSVPGRVRKAGEKLLCIHDWSPWRWSSKRGCYVRVCVDCGELETKD